MQTHPRWYRPILGLIAAVEMVFAVGILVDRYRTDTRPLYEGVAVEIPAEVGPLWGDLVLSAVVAVCAIALIGAISLWRTRPGQAGRLALVGLAPPLISGIVFFWFPPFWVMTVVAGYLFVQIARTPAVRQPAVG